MGWALGAANTNFESPEGLAQSQNETCLEAETEKQYYLSMLKKNQNNIMPLLIKPKDIEKLIEFDRKDSPVDKDSPYFQLQKQVSEKLQGISQKMVEVHQFQPKFSPKNGILSQINGKDGKGIDSNKKSPLSGGSAFLFANMHSDKHTPCQNGEEKTGGKNMRERMMDLREKIVSGGNKKVETGAGSLKNPRTPRMNEKSIQKITQNQIGGVRSMKMRSPETSLDKKPHRPRESRQSKLEICFLKPLRLSCDFSSHRNAGATCKKQ
jgi:hypothetical protein